MAFDLLKIPSQKEKGGNDDSEDEFLLDAYSCRNGRLLDKSAKETLWKLKSLSIVALTLLTSSQAILIVLSKSSGKYEYNIATSVFLVEALKCALSFGALCRTWSTIGFNDNNKLFASMDEITMCSAPIALDIIKNLLQFYTFAYLDVPSQQTLKNLDILSTGAFYHIILKRNLSELQWVALILLYFGCYNVRTEPIWEHADQISLQGWVIAMATTLVNGLSGVCIEVIMKNSPSRNINVLNFWLSVFGMIFKGISIFCYNFDFVMNMGFFFGYSLITILMIFSHALNLIAESFVLKYANNIVKVYSTSIAMILTTVVFSFLFDFQLSPLFYPGTMLVATALYLHCIRKL